MAAEWWFPPSELGVRLPVCGHSILERDFPASYSLNGHNFFDCPVCKLPQMFTVMSKSRDGIPTAALAWGSARRRDREDLHRAKQAEGRPHSLEGLLAAMSTRGVHRIDLASATVALGRRLQNKGPTATLVLRAWPQGCRILGGVVELPVWGVVLLTGCGVHFHGTKFTGIGTLVCCGDDFSATFNGCTFEFCTLYAVHGATVAFHDCTFSTGVVGLVAHGPATCATLRSCTLEQSITTVIAERGATVVQNGCTSRSSRNSLIAHDRGTRVTCTDGTLAGMTTPSQTAAGWGLQIVNAAVALQQCTVECFMYGVLADGRCAAVELRGCSVRAYLGGVAAEGGASATLRESDVQLYQPIAARDRAVGDDGQVPSAVTLRASEMRGSPGARAQMDRCHVSAQGLRRGSVLAQGGGAIAMRASRVSCTEGSVSASARGTISASHCSIRSETEFGCYSKEAGTVIRVVGGQVSGSTAAAACEAGGTFTARGAALSGLREAPQSARCVVAGREGSVLRLSECSVKHAHHGIEIADATCRAHNVEISDLFISDEQAATVGYQQNGGQLIVTGGAVRGCVVGSMTLRGGPVLGTVGAPARQGKDMPKWRPSTEFDGVLFEANDMAMHLAGGATLKASSCVFTGGPGPWTRYVTQGDSLTCTFGQTAVYIDECAGAASIAGCTFKLNGRDVHMYGKRGIEVLGCTFLGGGTRCCVYLYGQGSVKDSVFADATCAVAVCTRRCVVSGCCVTSGVTNGVMVAQGGGVAVSGCTLECSHTALDVREVGKATVSDSACIGGEVAVYAAGGSVVEAQRLTVRSASTAVQVDGAKSDVSLKDCQILGPGEEIGAGVMLNTTGACGTLEGCKVELCKMGLTVMPGASARMSSTEVLNCQCGVLVGVPEDMLGYQCSECGRSEGAAVAAAWEALHAAGGSGVPGARCMHEGAHALATLRGVSIRDCNTGMQVHVTGRVDAEHVEVWRAARAYSLKRWGSMSSFRECMAIRGSAPSVYAHWVLRPDSSMQSDCRKDTVPGIMVENEGLSSG